VTRRVVILGAAGFLGSHLVDQFLLRGDHVIGLDDLSSGSLRNIQLQLENERFTFIECDISEEIPIRGSIDSILNFASPASPPRYSAQQRQTLRTGSRGTENALELATATGARLIMASTSEVYGDPLVRPQDESYRGNVNPIGPRSCYDEAKRYAEAACMAFRRECNTNVGIARIFNTYGPRLGTDDGRVISNLIVQALRERPLTIYGDGTQTRSFCFVNDEIRGLMALHDSDECGPINIGNPDELKVNEVASLILELTGSGSEIVYCPLPTDDPLQRCPDIRLAKERLGWTPEVEIRDGLSVTIQWFQDYLRSS
jgi:dTDP-glucose 4,6-dehydratase